MPESCQSFSNRPTTFMAWFVGASPADPTGSSPSAGGAGCPCRCSALRTPPDRPGSHTCRPRVVQPLQQADVAFPGEAQGVGQSERCRRGSGGSTTPGSSDRSRENQEVEPDLAEAAVGPQQVGRIRSRAGRAARGERGVLVLRQERRVEVHGIDVDLGLSADFAELVEPVLPDIRDVDVDAHGSVIWTPAFHCVEDGMSASYGHTEVNWGGPRISRPDASCCSSA